MHRGKIVRFALDMKVEGMPLPNPEVDGANELPPLGRQSRSGRNDRCFSDRAYRWSFIWWEISASVSGLMAYSMRQSMPSQ
jgi:hypothetical protein